MKKETPLMKQYNDIKSKYPKSILLFRVGDFYETFHEDEIVTYGKMAAKSSIRDTSPPNGNVI